MVIFHSYVSLPEGKYFKIALFRISELLQLAGKI